MVIGILVEGVVGEFEEVFEVIVEVLVFDVLVE